MNALPRFDEQAAEAVDRVISLGAGFYRREVMLHRLIRRSLDVFRSPADETADIVRRLTDAIEGEETRGRSGHWTYSPSRLIGLRQAHRAETERLNAELEYLDPCAGEGEV